MCLYPDRRTLLPVIRAVFLGVLLLPLEGQAGSTDVYKYKDDSGNWVFADSKPVDSDFEVINLETRQRVSLEPEFYTTTEDGRTYLVVENQLFAPIEVRVRLGRRRNPIDRVIESKATRRIAEVNEPDELRYKWVIGDPDIMPSHEAYLFPVGSGGSFEITQGFNGRFSHSQRPNQYALDIGMQVGTHIVAAREGTVIGVKDDYHMSGRSDYFYDKANYVRVLHPDGTYAVYAHLLRESATVSSGDYVTQGQMLGRSGSTGYSSGPHLHFVIQRNVGLETRSIPFLLKTPEGRHIPLEPGTVIYN